MNDPRLSAINQMRNLTNISGENKIKEKGEVSFREMMNNYLDDANNLQIESDHEIRRVIAGEDVDPHDVMIAAEKANLSFDLVMEIRNKMLEAYREVMKTQI